MKKSVIVASVLLVLLAVLGAVFFASVAVADEKATKEECVTKVAEAAKMVREVGVDAAIKKLLEESGPYRWKDSYVFCTYFLMVPGEKIILSAGYLE